jgi:Protein FAM135
MLMQHNCTHCARAQDLELELMYARLSALEASSGDADDGTVADLTGEQAPGPLEFTVASRVQYRLDLSEGGTLREYIPVHFDGGHFVKLDAMVHASLQHIKHRPALRRRGSAPLVIAAAATGSSNSMSSSSAGSSSASSAALSASGRRKSADTAVNGSSSNSSSGGAAGRSSANSSVNSTRPAVPVKEESAWGIFSKLLTGVTASTDQPKSSTAASSSRPYTATATAAAAAAAQQENSVSPFWTTYLLRVPKSATAALIGSGYSDWGFGSSSSATGSSHNSSSSSLTSSGQLSRHNSSTLQRRESCTGGTSAAGLELRVGMYHCFVAPMAAALEGVSASASTTSQRVVTKVVWYCVYGAV